MTHINQPNETVDEQVERLFQEHPPLSGQVCTNPVTGSHYLGGVDPVEPEKRKARAALIARERFAVDGPEDAQPLPLSAAEIDDRKYDWACKDPALSYIVSRFAYSLSARDFEVKSPPSFKDFACGMTASEHAPDHVKKDGSLRKRYPPRVLLGLTLGNYWVPPQQGKRSPCSLTPGRRPR